MLRIDLDSIHIGACVDTLQDIERRREQTINAALAGGQSTDDAIATGDRLFGARISGARDRIERASEFARIRHEAELQRKTDKPWWQFWP